MMPYKFIYCFLFCLYFLGGCKNNQDETLPISLKCTPDTLQLNNKEQKSMVYIQCSTSWEIVGEASWCKFVPSSGIGEMNMVIQVDENNSDTLRKITLSVQAGSEEKTIQVFQQGKNSEPAPFCLFDLTGPQMNQEDAFRFVRFNWKTTATVEEPVEYMVSWSKNQQNWTHSARLSAKEYTVQNPLEANVKFFWKVTAFTATGKSCESRMSSFMTGKHTYYEGYVITLEENRKENPVNLVFVGDGFQRQDYEDGTFIRIIQEAVKGLFIREPFPTYRSYFNIYAVVAMSNDRGISDHSVKKHTVFGMSYLPSTESLGSLSINSTAVFAYAQMVPGVTDIDKTPVAVIGYDSRSIGLTGIEISGKAFAMMTWGRGGAIFTDLVAHELGGHAIGMLGDEYVVYNANVSTNEADLRRVKIFLGAGWYQNIALTNDPEKVPWKHFLKLPGYEEVGVYEGARFYSKGLWRSSYSSSMYASGRLYYNAPSREAIVKRILSIAGESYSFEKFLEKDKSTSYEKE